MKDRTKVIIERVSAGIKEFDKLIEGGFEKNSINLVVASGGSGKTIFCTQFLVDGLRKGERCLYITFEERKNEFYNNMLELGFNLEEEEEKGNFFFLEYTPEKVKTMLDEGGGVIESIVLTKKIKRVAIDSITSFGLLFENDLERRQSAISLYNMLRKWECTTVLTYERDPVSDAKTNSKALEFESDSIILLYNARGNKSRERYIEILKMRGTNHSKNIYPFYINNNGIEVSDKPFYGDIKNML
ncbi:MAG: ATPase domain-containing protein [Nanoarchaeota archaeon]|nr:ATPase domain-containing protein [Nanoarchaeota archaeon]